MRLKNDVNIDSIKTIVERYPESNDILSKRVKEKLKTYGSIDNDDFKCPISFNFFMNPVLAIESETTFEKEQINTWLEQNDTCPLTRKLISTIVKNSMIHDIMEELVHYDMDERLQRIDELGLSRLIETENKNTLSNYFNKIIYTIDRIGNNDLFYKLIVKIPDVINRHTNEFLVGKFINSLTFSRIMDMDYCSTLISMNSIFKFYVFEFNNWIENKSDEKKREVLTYLNSINKTIFETNSTIRLLMTKYKIRKILSENNIWFFQLKLEDIVKIVEIELSIDNLSSFDYLPEDP